MTRPALHITTEERGEISVLNLNGRLVLDDGDAIFRDAVNELVGQQRLQMVVNLADVTYIDSAGIGVLIGRFLSVRRRGGDMKLANLTSRSHRVMTITQLLDVFDCFDSVEAAVESLIANPQA
jgi:anti-sigma B factor antagonist